MMGRGLDDAGLEYLQQQVLEPSAKFLVKNQDAFCIKQHIFLFIHNSSIAATMRNPHASGASCVISHESM
jgi:hypothetical protein